MQTPRLRLRAARHLQEVFRARAKTMPAEHAALDQLASSQRALERTRRSLSKALSKRWTAAVEQLRLDLLGELRSVEHAAAQACLLLDQPLSRPLTLRTLLEEFQQLEDEFGHLQIDLKSKVLSVVTEPIVLEGIHLGAFEIRLSWSRLASEAQIRCLEVVALDPNAAAANSSVTHPHVHDQILCAGEATVPIQRALQQGRITDAFCLVRSVLVNYNPDSAHVSLDQWDGQDCYECGSSVPTDDLRYCERCGYDYCSDCIGRCNRCDVLRCDACLQCCAVCDGDCCSHCLTASSSSSRSCCRDCLVTCTSCRKEVARDELDQAGLCPACLKKRSGEEAAASFQQVRAQPEPSPDLEPETQHEPDEAVAAAT